MRRAVAIQMIINKELGLNFCENPWQGSFIVDKLTDIVEEAVYKEFEAISERGGVLGAMDTMYQRGKIQEESLYYEHKKHDGSLPLVGANKGNIGHMLTASGMASILKVLLAMRHGVIPPTIGVEEMVGTPAARLGLGQVVREATPWPRGGARGLADRGRLTCCARWTSATCC